MLGTGSVASTSLESQLFAASDTRVSLVNAVDATMSIDYIAYGPLVCAGVDPVASVPQSPSGYGCEVPERLSSTSYRTSRTFIPNSTLLAINGLVQTRGTDYTEGSDKRTLTLSSSVSSGAAVAVCYFGEATNA